MQKCASYQKNTKNILTIRALFPKETELIKKAKANDRVAQLMLYNQHAPKMLAVARYYIKDLQHAEDVLMKAFYKAFSKLNQFTNCSFYHSTFKF